MVRWPLTWRLWQLLMLLLVGAIIIFALLPLATMPQTMISADELLGGDGDDELSYGVMIDAGSTGSRLFVYCWPATSGSDRDLIDIRPVLDAANLPVVRKVSPGLSSFANTPENASVYIKPLLDHAANFVPEKKRPGTPVFILATAGMRLVPEKQQAAILANLHSNLPSIVDFQILPEHIKVIEGKWEGVYSWIAVNYILGRFKHNDTVDSSNRSSTVGMIDMGGASVQIAFEFTGKLIGDKNDHLVQTINLGCRDNDNAHAYQLYVTTFLGFGVNEALKRYEQELSDQVYAENDTNARDTCLPVNLVKTVRRDDGSTFARKGIGRWDECLAIVTNMLRRNDHQCESVCFFDGVARPTNVNLSTIELYGFSEYWYSLYDVLGLGGRYDYSLFAERAREFCTERWSTIMLRARKDLYPRADDERLRTQCFKSAWVAAVLHEGFGIDRQSNAFSTVFNINDQEVQWTLGAMLYNMRYFPLREIQLKNWDIKKRLEHRNGGLSELTIYQQTIALVAGALAMALAVRYCLRRRRNGGWSTSSMHRSRSVWSYMMLSQDEQLPSSLVRVDHSSDYVY